MEPRVSVQQRTPIRCLSVDKNELRALLEKIQERSIAAGEIEVDRYYDPIELPPEKAEANRQEIRSGFRLFVSVDGVDGTSLHGNIKDIFDSPNFPSDVKAIFFDTGTPLKNKNYQVANQCVLFLDFSRPEVLNFSFQPSAPTANGSNVEVRGLDATWVNGVFYEVVAFARERPSTAKWLHQHGVYDVMLWLLGIPASFWGCFRLSNIIGRVFPSSFMQAASYVYVFFITLFAYRILFQYARWIWPPVEYRQLRGRAVAHKAALVALVLGVLANVVWSVIQAL